MNKTYKPVETSGLKEDETKCLLNEGIVLTYRNHALLHMEQERRAGARIFQSLRVSLRPTEQLFTAHQQHRGGG